VTGFVGLLPLLLFTLPAGALLDRLPRRRVMLVCQIGRAAAVGSLAFAVAAGRASFPLVLVVFFLDVTGSIFFSVAERSALPQLVPPSQMRTAVAQNQARQYASGLAGRPLGGLFFSLAEALPFVVDACSYVFSIASLLLIRGEFETARVHAEHVLVTDVREGLVWLWRQPFLRTISLLVTASDLNVNALYVVVIVLAKRHGASPTVVGLVVACIGVGGLIGAVIAPWTSRRLSARGAIATTLCTMTLLLPLLLVTTTPIVYGVIYGGMFVAYPTWSAIHWAYFAALVPDELQGRVQSIATLLSLGPIPIAVLLVGVSLQWLGTPFTVLLLFGGMLLASLGALTNRHIRNAPPLLHG
jgi:MFS family permease